jgi:hypothetical protein
MPGAGSCRRDNHHTHTKYQAGYNALMVTDTSFMRNPHYHQPIDTIDTLDLPFLMAVIDGLESGVNRLS